MSVPLDRLYDYLDDVCNHDILIYRFLPHGSKNLKDLTAIKLYRDWFDLMSKPVMFCHDQEPLSYDSYTNDDFDSLPSKFTLSHDVNEKIRRMHFRRVFQLPYNCFEKSLLLHSEQNSAELSKFEKNNFIGVYWWSHALIARDWYRFAQIDPALLVPKTIDKDFLIYNRAWSGTREYRLKFAEILLNQGVVDSCNIKFNPTDQGHYSQYTFKNQSLAITRFDIEQHIKINNTDSNASADYQSQDYVTCGIEVVLETLFDDSRHHLTEKTLRPIACGCPFMLVGTAGSLEYLRRYGFKTFNQYINEEYDTIQDPLERLHAIVKEMKRIASLDTDTKKQLFNNLQEIANYNKNLFFSHNWHQSIVDEFVNNTNLALKQLWPSRTGDLWLQLKQQVTRDFVDTSNLILYRSEYKEQLVRWLDQDIPVLQI